MLKRIVAGLMIAVATASSAVAASFEDGLAAAQRGDFATARSVWRPLAEEGDARSQFNLGFLYEKSLGVPQDYAEAQKWYGKAAEQGHAKAQYNIGVMYDRGRGVAQDYSEAVKWYRRAAEQGDVYAQNNLGAIYERGHGVAQDFSEAAKWYRLAADGGDALAQKNLGLLYNYGKGVGGRDLALAYLWLSLAAAQGEPVALANRDAVATELTPDQLAEAQRVVREWKPKPNPQP